MKKILIFVVLCIATIQFTNAQIIELKGMGTLGDDPATITFNEFDLNSIEKVVVEATAIIKNGDVNQMPGSISFSDADETKTVPFNYVKKHYSIASFDPWYAGNHKGYYTAVFNTVDAGGITLDNKIGVYAFYAYIFLNDGSMGTYSLINRNEVPAFLHALGPDYTVEGEFMLPPSPGSRNATIEVPLSDNETIDEDQRKGTVIFYTNGVPVMEKSVTFELNQEEKNFHIEELTLYDIPAEVDKLTVGVYSLDGRGIGDSFFAGKFLLTVEQDPGCTHTQGYWKTHSEYGPAPYDDTWAMLDDGADTEFYKSGQTWYKVFWTPVRGDTYYQLAHQYMAAHLSMLSGAWVPVEVHDAMDMAKDLFENNKPEEISKEYGYLAELLDNYNNGIIGPGHCDDDYEVEREDDEQEYAAQTQNSGKGKGKAKGKNKSAQIEQTVTEIDGLAVYPNPALNSATIYFTPVSDGNASIDLYNSVGQKISRLLERNVNRDVPVSIQFNSSEYKEGLYILRLQSENGITTTRVQIAR